MEKAWIAVMSEAERVSELHLEVRASLMNKDFEKIDLGRGEWAL